MDRLFVLSCHLYSRDRSGGNFRTKRYRFPNTGQAAIRYRRRNLPIVTSGFVKNEASDNESKWTKAARRQAVDLTEPAVVMLDAAGNVRGWSQGAERLTGYTGSEIIGQNLSVFFTEKDRKLGAPAGFLDQAAANGRMQCNSWHVRRNGTSFAANIMLIAILDADSNPAGFAAIIRDDPVQEPPVEHLRQVVELAPNPMVMVDSTGRIVMTNSQAEHLLGYGRDELLGCSVDILVPPRFRGHHYGLRASLLAEPWMRSTGVGHDLYALRKNNSEVAVEVGAIPIGVDQGHVILAAIFDISNRKQKEERIYSALKEKELMLGEIHHRVKNNLQMVCSLLDLQSAQISDNASLSLLKESQNRIKSMALIHEMLYVSKNFADVDFRSFLEHLVPSLVTAYAANPDRIAIAINYADIWLPIDTAVPCGLLANELISNAMRHAFPAGRHGTIRVDVLSQNDDIVFSVSDDGVGIPDDCELAGSTSLGLNLVTLLAEQIGASLTIRRLDPTCITLRFPIPRSR